MKATAHSSTIQQLTLKIADSTTNGTWEDAPGAPEWIDARLYGSPLFVFVPAGFEGTTLTLECSPDAGITSYTYAVLTVSADSLVAVPDLAGASLPTTVGISHMRFVAGTAQTGDSILYVSVMPVTAP